MDVIITSIGGRETSRYWRITLYPTTVEENRIKQRFGTLYSDVVCPSEIHQDQIIRLRFIHPEFTYTLAINPDTINHRPQAMPLVKDVLDHLYDTLRLDIRPRLQLVIQHGDTIQNIPAPIDCLMMMCP